jgi:hypothetical protein
MWELFWFGSSGSGNFRLSPKADLSRSGPMIGKICLYGTGGRLYEVPVQAKASTGIQRLFKNAEQEERFVKGF